MTTTLFVILFKKMFRQQSIFLKLLVELFSVFLTLVLIYYASESFSFKSAPAVQSSLSLFIFLLIGEVALIVPMSSAERFLSNFSNIRNQQFYQTLLGLRISPFRYILSLVMSDLFFPLLRVLLILIGGILLSPIHLTFLSVCYFFILQIFSIFIFLLMAILASYFYLKFNRGFSFFYTLQTVSTILGGAYFPTSIFPIGLKNLSAILPQTQILAASRMIFNGAPLPLNAGLILVFWLALFTILAIVFNTYLVKNLKKNARFY